jgi:ribosomal protein L44E
MKFNQVENTYICQFSKPHNKQMLEGYKMRRDKSGAELARYYKDVVKALSDTPAFGVSGVNKMLNDLTYKVRATLIGAKRGKTSAYAHAGWLLNQLEYFGNEEAKACYKGSHKLAPLLTADELILLETI